jgi:hypothetical protein
MTAIDGVRRECVACGSHRIKTLNGAENCVDCLERGVEMFGAPDRLKRLAEMLVYGTAKGSLTRDEMEALRGDLVDVATRLVVMSRDAERAQHRLAKAVVCGL